MLRVCCLIATALALFPAAAAQAEKFGANALLDLGIVAPADQTSFARGGLGKTEFGGGAQTLLPLGQALLDLHVNPTEALGAFATVRLAPGQHAPFDVLEAYARYQPVATTSWLWSLKGGAFFPPISLENEGIGWTSPWTLTPSAINSWVGDELRTIGGETTLEWRHASGAVGVVAALFGANDPAGTMLDDRGWVFDSRPAGLFGEPRVPDVEARSEGRVPPAREEPFKEIDSRPGWYAGASLRQDGIGRLAVLHYDNEGDPAKFIGGDFAWRTKFTSIAAEADIGDVVILGQGMFGDTTIAPFAGFSSTTGFQAGYLLAGYYFGDYRIAGRVDLFATQQHNNPGGAGPGEHGYALTLAGTWNPRNWLRLTAELLRVDSQRGQRALAGQPTRAVDLQGQLVARLLF